MDDYYLYLVISNDTLEMMRTKNVSGVLLVPNSTATFLSYEDACQFAASTNRMARTDYEKHKTKYQKLNYELDLCTVMDFRVPEDYYNNWIITRDNIDFYEDHTESHEIMIQYKLKHQSQRNTVEYINWRKSIFNRDQYTCKECGQKGGELNAHHLKRFSTHPELRLDLENGITLCKQCHKQEHRKSEDGD